MKNILEYISDILKKYNDNEIIADENFYRSIYEVFTKIPGINKYLNKLIVITPENHMDAKYDYYTDGIAGLFGQAAYRHETNEMVVYMRNLSYFAKGLSAKICSNENDVVTTYNLLVTQTLLHEFEHVLQEIKMNSGTDIESDLLRSVYSTEEETTTSYDCSLAERLAEIRAYEHTLKLYEMLNIDCQSAFEYFNEKLKDSYLAGYTFVDDDGYLTSEEKGNFISSTDYYASLRNCKKEEYYNISKKIQGPERFLYGLSIPLEEYQQYKKEQKDSFSL